MAKVLKYLFSSRSIPIIICTSLMLFFLGVYFMVAFKSNALVRTLKNESNLLVELKDNTEEYAVNEIMEFLKDDNTIPRASIEFVSKAKAMALMESEIGIDFLDLSDENPFFDVIQFNMDNTKGDVAAVTRHLKALPEVHNAFVQQSYVDEIAVNVRRFSRLALVVGIFFSVLAITLIFNAIKLSLVESKSSFYTLKLLGSDWNFIKKPFLQRAFYSGILSSMMAILLFILAMSYFALSNDIFKQIISVWNIVLVTLIMLLVGFFVNILSTNTILNRYLSMKEEDLYS